MGHQHLGLAVLEDVGDVGRRGMPVEGHGIGADMRCGQARLQEGEVVAHQQGDGVAGAEPQAGEAAGGLAGSRLQLAARQKSICLPDSGADSIFHEARPSRASASGRHRP